MHLTLTPVAAKCTLFWRHHWCAHVLIKSPLDRFRTPTERFVKSSNTEFVIGCRRRRVWNTRCDWSSRHSALFSRDCFPCGLMAPPATDWDGAGTERRYGGSCNTTEEKKAITPQIPAGFWSQLFWCIWEKGRPGCSLGWGLNLEAGGRG